MSHASADDQEALENLVQIWLDNAHKSYLEGDRAALIECFLLARHHGVQIPEWVLDELARAFWKHQELMGSESLDAILQISASRQGKLPRVKMQHTKNIRSELSWLMWNIKHRLGIDTDQAAQMVAAMMPCNHRYSREKPLTKASINDYYSRYFGEIQYNEQNAELLGYLRNTSDEENEEFLDYYRFPDSCRPSNVKT